MSYDNNVTLDPIYVGGNNESLEKLSITNEQSSWNVNYLSIIVYFRCLLFISQHTRTIAIQLSFSLEIKC